MNVNIGVGNVFVIFGIAAVYLYYGDKEQNFTLFTTNFLRPLFNLASQVLLSLLNKVSVQYLGYFSAK